MSKPASVLDLDDDDDSWDNCYSDELALEMNVRFFFYIGQINLKDWRFTLLQMQETESLSGEDGSEVCYLRPKTDDETAANRRGVYTDMEVLTQLLDLQKSWSLHLRGFSGNCQHWSPAGVNGGVIPTVPLPLPEDLHNFVFWKGSTIEASRRREARQQREKKAGTKRTAKHQTQQRFRPSKKRRKVIQGVVEPQAALEFHFDDSNDDEEGDGDNDKQYDNDQPDDFSDFSDNSPVGSQSENEEEQENYDPFLEEIAEADDMEIEARASEASLQSDLEHVEHELDECEENVNVFVQEEPVVAAEAAVAAADGASGDAPDPAESRAPRVISSRGGSESRDVFVLPNNQGSLRYYHGTGAMVAFCPLGRCRHSKDCRKQSTCAALKGSGRPLGLLVGWLLAAETFDTKEGHVHGLKLSLEQRQHARNYFMSLPGAAEFSEYEMRRDAGDPEEPLRV
eukprot:symbB.v1.2.017389.t1/scaffold1357.1/size159079/7